MMAETGHLTRSWSGEIQTFTRGVVDIRRPFYGGQIATLKNIGTGRSRLGPGKPSEQLHQCRQLVTRPATWRAGSWHCRNHGPRRAQRNRASRISPPISITATPSVSSGSPAHASTWSSWPCSLQVTSSLRPRRTPTRARQSLPFSISTRSARSLQLSLTSCRLPGTAVTESATEPSQGELEKLCPLRTRWGGEPPVATVVHAHSQPRSPGLM